MIMTLILSAWCNPDLKHGSYIAMPLPLCLNAKKIKEQVTIYKADKADINTVVMGFSI